MKNMSQKTKFRMTFLTLCLIISSILWLSTTFSYASKIVNIKDEISQNEKLYDDKKDEEEELEDEVLKYQNDEYKSKLARENYYFSKDNEVIFKIED